MNGGRSVHCDTGHQPRLHQIVDDRSHSHFDDVATQTPDDRLTCRSGVKDCANQRAQAVARENVRKLGNEAEYVFQTIHRLPEHSGVDLALAFLEWVRRDTIEVERFDGIVGIHN